MWRPADVLGELRYSTGKMSRYFPVPRSLTAYFCSSGTFLPRAQNKGLNRVSPYRRQFPKTRFWTSGKESTGILCRVVKCSVFFRHFLPAESVNSAWGICKLRVRRWQTPRAAFEISLCLVSIFPILGYDFCKGFFAIFVWKTKRSGAL